MTDAHTRAALRDLERARMRAQSDALRRSEELCQEAADALTAIHARHDADVAARILARDEARALRDGAALAMWSAEDELRRREVVAGERAIAEAERALAEARLTRAALAREIAAGLARWTALREPEGGATTDE